MQLSRVSSRVGRCHGRSQPCLRHPRSCHARRSVAVFAGKADVEVKEKKKGAQMVDPDFGRRAAGALTADGAAAKEEEFTDGPDVSPSTKQVQGFLNTLCTETEIAEINLKMGSFQLMVRRSLTANPATASSAPAAAASATPLAASLPGAPAMMAGSAPATPFISIDEPNPEDSVDEALVYVAAPKVGVFRRGKYAAGKRIGKGNAVDVGDQVRKGQLLGYVEQLGTFWAVEAPQAGEVARFEVNDGDPVAYKQVVLELAPYFGGHIIGDSKYA